MRLNKYIAASGVTSRRKADELIKQGKIKINGELITDMGYIVNEGDEIKHDGRIINTEEKKIYVMINKPQKFLSSVTDDRNRKTVIDIVKGKYKERLYPVGRLDYDTEGLLILTNDGEITKKLTHPSHDIKKTYFVKTDKKMYPDLLKKIENGVQVEDYITRECKIKKLQSKDGNECLITIGEGKNRQIRKMFETQNMKVVFLKRLSVGKIELGNLKTGEFRELTKEELKYLMSINWNKTSKKIDKTITINLR